jgi:hypothetical protein
MSIRKKECVVQSRINATYKLKIKKYAERKHVSEAEVVRLALEKFLHNITAK